MRRNLVAGFAALFGLGFFVACVPDGPHHAVDAAAGGGAVGAMASGISYDAVKPIFAGVCAKCHSSGRPPDWLNFADAQKNALNGKLGSRVVVAKDMPPPSDPVAALITQKDRDLIDAWIRAGAPEHAAAVASTDAGKSTGGPAAPGLPMPPMFGGKILGTFAQSCSGCHADAADQKSSVPRLAGLSADYILSQLKAFRSAERLDPTYTMNVKVTADGVTAADLEEAAAYYGTVVKPTAPKDERPDPSVEAKAESGRTIAERSCVQCHANPGPNDALVPLLNGQSAAYLKNQLESFRSAGPNRRGSIMSTYARMLSPTDIENVSAYFARRPLPVVPH